MLNKNINGFLSIIMLGFIYLSCKTIPFKHNANESYALLKNYRFYNGSKIDSVFFSLHLSSSNLDIKEYYVEEKVYRISCDNYDSKIVDDFLNSLSIYNAIFLQDKIVLNRDYFFKCNNFKNKYKHIINGKEVVLYNLLDLYNYDFAKKLTLDTIEDNVVINFPNSKCKLYCNMEIFKDDIYFNRLNHLIDESYNLYMPSIILPKVSMNK